MSLVLGYRSTRCRALFACWITGGVEFTIAPEGWTWQHPAPGEHQIYPDRADVPDLGKTVAIASFHVDRRPAVGAPPDTSTAGTLISEITDDAFLIWTANAQGVFTDIGVSMFILVLDEQL